MTGFCGVEISTLRRRVLWIAALCLITNNAGAIELPVEEAPPGLEIREQIILGDKGEISEVVDDILTGGPPGICPQVRNTPQAPESFLKMTNPLKPNEKNLLAGKTLFTIDAKPTPCRVCHGFEGNGMGIIFHRLETKPRNFTCYYTMRDIPDGQLYWIIKNGSPGTAMPSFSYLADEQVWQLILYLRQFAQ